MYVDPVARLRGPDAHPAPRRRVIGAYLQRNSIFLQQNPTSVPTGPIV